MRGKLIVILVSTMMVLLLAGVAMAQEDSTCAIDSAEIITVIDSVCSTTGNNELCYGNNEVAVETRANAPDVDFNSPGDLMSVDYIQALYLSALNQMEDLWGVAQMRLVTTTSLGPQEVTLLLYGDVEVENAVDPTIKVTIQTTASINIRNLPRLSGAVLASAPSGSELVAVGRLEDTSWIRVLVPETSAIGWLSADFVEVVDEDVDSLEVLDVMESNDTYFGPMQAFYINTGTNLSCNNVATDGLIIQTPEGTARVTVLINEVSIELLAPPTGGTATAIIQANQTNGMNISMTSGSAIVNANNSVYSVNSGFSTTIGMTGNLTPSGEFSVPTTISPEDLLDLPVLNIMDNPSLNPTGFTDVSGTDVSNGTGTLGQQNPDQQQPRGPNENANENATSGGNQTGQGTTPDTSNATGNSTSANGQGGTTGSATGQGQGDG